MRPGDEIRLVKRNLDFAIALWKGAVSGRVPPGPLLRPGSDLPLFGQQTENSQPSESDLTAELTRGAANQMRAAFALSALQAQRSLESAFPGEPIEEEWVELRAARSVMYLIGRAVQRSILMPVWECPPAYRRLFHIRRFGLTLNATGLEGRVLSWDDFGGLERYLALLEYCAASANAAAAAGPRTATRTLPKYVGSQRNEFGGVIGSPATASEEEEPPTVVRPLRNYPGEHPDRRLAPDAPPFLPPQLPDDAGIEEDSWDSSLQEQAGQWHSIPSREELARGTNGPATSANGPNGHRRPLQREGSPLGPVAGNLIHRFVQERCETGDGRRTLAGELYAGFVAWCGNSSVPAVSQRAFGMRLTSLGFRRKRRGHGKHWWEGIRLAETP